MTQSCLVCLSTLPSTYSNMRVLLPPKASPERSSRFMKMRGPLSALLRRGSSSRGVGRCASWTRGNLPSLVHSCLRSFLSVMARELTGVLTNGQSNIGHSIFILHPSSFILHPSSLILSSSHSPHRHCARRIEHREDRETIAEVARQLRDVLAEHDHCADAEVAPEINAAEREMTLLGGHAVAHHRRDGHGHETDDSAKGERGEKENEFVHDKRGCQHPDRSGSKPRHRDRCPTPPITQPSSAQDAHEPPDVESRGNVRNDSQTVCLLHVRRHRAECDAETDRRHDQNKRQQNDSRVTIHFDQDRKSVV